MTKSKIFLGVTAFALAIAGAITTKASNKFTAYTAFTVNGDQFGRVACQPIGGVQCKKVVTLPGNIQKTLTLYTVGLNHILRTVSQ
jgi:hypothetical protein